MAHSDSSLNWTPTLAARLGLLIGMGHSARSITTPTCVGPLIPTTENNLYRVARRLGLSFKCNTNAHNMLIKISHTTKVALFRVSKEYGMSPEELVSHILIILSDPKEPDLVHNILDDPSSRRTPGCGV